MTARIDDRNEAAQMSARISGNAVKKKVWWAKTKETVNRKKCATVYVATRASAWVMTTMTINASV
jgi:hypothetical protein